MNILIVGSAPSAEEIKNNKDIIVKYNKIYCINNAWFLLRDINKTWIHSTDFIVLGTLFPLEEDKKYIEEEIQTCLKYPLWYDYEKKLGSGTMILNTLYHVINTYVEEKGLNIHIIGCDLDYSNKEKTHFYGLGKVNGDVKKQLEENTPEYSDVAADPLRYGIDVLKIELNKTLDIPNISIKTLSQNPNQLLPYEKVSIKDLVF